MREREAKEGNGRAARAERRRRARTAAARPRDDDRRTVVSQTRKGKPARAQGKTRRQQGPRRAIAYPPSQRVNEPQVGTIDDALRIVEPHVWLNHAARRECRGRRQHWRHEPPASHRHEPLPSPRTTAIATNHSHLTTGSTLRTDTPSMNELGAPSRRARAQRNTE